jgi:TPR repeat protein
MNPFDTGWEGIRRDYIEAVKWYRKAAEQGLARAQNNLGSMYKNGRGVSLDYVQAAKWYRKAAEQNLAEAQYNLGKLYHSGHGVSQDYVHALMWFNLAAADTLYMRMLSRLASADDLEENDLEENRDELIEKMTPAQIAEAQRLAKEWKDKLYANSRKSYRA